MKRLMIPLSILMLMTVASCDLFRSRKGPIAQESSQLESQGRDLRAEGEKLVKDGIADQNRAKELRVLAADKRRQADVLISQGDPTRANQLRLEAEQQEADAVASDNRGRDTEARGRQLITSGENAIHHSKDLEKQGENINRKTVD